MIKQKIPMAKKSDLLRTVLAWYYHAQPKLKTNYSLRIDSFSIRRGQNVEYSQSWYFDVSLDFFAVNRIGIVLALSEFRAKAAPCLLDQSLIDRSSCYLMLKSDSDSLIDYIERYLMKTTNNIRTLVGSQITDDLDGEAYDYRILMDVILYAEKPVTLIMRKMDKCSSSLYDLCNQNFYNIRR
ncbi:unnamed protein product [Didymodactylos carnosus]|uniref:Uncharacterized protein n=1 Tax=Didymodactylos carnosus TaxID=1234261 RepID=A0A814RCC0_9BILA|nr:unnamed protein product [Didymodactylos carnosus]CAF1132043.1 unnamed protein product [Didymodactylos carnosus]CAF3868170.1 unnamed protein product [Didymodactylos carnosus]CAF3895831.1 unnamed protein product [Didymodactylos carnosus]